jgi:hypothetical protein
MHSWCWWQAMCGKRRNTFDNYCLLRSHADDPRSLQLLLRPELLALRFSTNPCSFISYTVLLDRILYTHWADHRVHH